MNSKATLKALLIIGGTLSLILGTIGIVLPLLPTTPFLLLSAYCYTKSSTRLYNWLLNHKIFGLYIYNYITYKAVGLKTKIFAITLLWLTLAISALLVSSVYMTLGLVIIGLGVTLHLLNLNTLSKEQLILNKRKFSNAD